MTPLVWIGTIVTLLGLGGLLWVIRSAKRAQNAGLDDDALRDLLQRLSAPNLASLGVCAIGLMCVVLGLILG